MNIPEKYKLLTAAQAQYIVDNDISIHFLCKSDHDEHWSTIDYLKPLDVKMIGDGNWFIIIDERYYWIYFGYDIEFPKLDINAKNVCTFFGNTLHVQFTEEPRELEGEIFSVIQSGWQVLKELSKGTYREIAFVDSVRDAEAAVIKYYSDLANISTPGFKFNFNFSE